MNRNLNRNQNQQNLAENRKRFNNLRQKHKLKIVRNNDNQNNGRPVKILTAHKQQISREAVVKKNLQHLKEATAAKRIAQNHYYHGQGKSPLLKNEPVRTSVQDRIGRIRNQQNQRRIPQQNPQKINLKQQKVQRVNNFKNKKVFTKNNNPQIKVMHTLDGKVKILRKMNNNNNNRIKNQKKSNNFVVNVPNQTTYVPHESKNLFDNYNTKFKMTCDPKIQQEIQLLQNQLHAMPIMPITTSIPNVINRTLTVSDFRVPIATTTISINERFNRYKFVQ